MTTPKIIKKRRQELNMTQEELAKKMGLQGKSSVANMEKPDAKISLKTILKLTGPLQCTEAYLLGMTSDPNCATIDLVLPKDPSGFEVWPKEEKKLPKIHGGQTKTVKISIPDEKTVVAQAITAVGSGHGVKPEKIVGAQVIQQHKKPESEKDKLIKKILDMDEKSINHLLKYIEFVMSKPEGGE